jgi:hypothetical protein
MVRGSVAQPTSDTPDEPGEAVVPVHAHIDGASVPQRFGDVPPAIRAGQFTQICFPDGPPRALPSRKPGRNR